AGRTPAAGNAAVVPDPGCRSWDRTRKPQCPPPYISKWAWTLLESIPGWLKETVRKLLGLPRPERLVRKAPPVQRPGLNLELLEQRAAAGALSLSANPLPGFVEGQYPMMSFLATLSDS